MRHAHPEDLGPLELLLGGLRGLPRLRETKPGTFYRGSRAFLHFHVDPAGLFADVRTADAWERLPVGTPEQQQALLDRVTAATGG